MTDDMQLRLALLQMTRGNLDEAMRAYEWVRVARPTDGERRFDAALAEWAGAGHPVSVH